MIRKRHLRTSPCPAHKAYLRRNNSGKGMQHRQGKCAECRHEEARPAGHSILARPDGGVKIPVPTMLPMTRAIAALRPKLSSGDAPALLFATSASHDCSYS